MFENLIPVYRTTGVVEYHDAAYLWVNRGSFNLTFDNGDRLTKAVEKSRASLAPFTSDGQYFRQVLDSGRKVHSLRGVRGSKN
jgi:hypothetical protein